MTTFEHAIRLLRNDIKREETRTIHSYEKNRQGWLERRERRLELLREELAVLQKLSDNTIDTCCMCGELSYEIVARKDGDGYCATCHKKHCEHINNGTIKVGDGETITICYDCDIEL